MQKGFEQPVISFEPKISDFGEKSSSREKSKFSEKGSKTNSKGFNFWCRKILSVVASANELFSNNFFT